LIRDVGYCLLLGRKPKEEERIECKIDFSYRATPNLCKSTGSSNVSGSIRLIGMPNFVREKKSKRQRKKEEHFLFLNISN
jgi:hypothetical protein